MPVSTPDSIGPIVRTVPTTEPTVAPNGTPEVQPVSLRVREKPAARADQGPLEGLFRLLFGGIFP
jgi:hypothetical protein